MSIYGVGAYGAGTYGGGGDWIAPIWIRTEQDVERAKYLNRLISQKGFDALSESDKAEWTRGLVACLNYYDLNRIEKDSKWLSLELYKAGYGFFNLKHKTGWTMKDFPYSEHMERIRSNVQVLLNWYHEQGVDLPVSLENPNFAMINDLEHILQLMKEMIARMKFAYRYAGTFFSGQDLVLP